MMPQFQPIRVNNPSQYAELAQGIGQLGQAYQDRGFRQDMGGVQSSKDLMELYTMHPDKYDPVRVKQMQQQEEEDMNSSFFEKLEGAQNQSEALNVIKSDPSRYSKKVGEFMQSLPSPKQDALRKDFLEEGAYVNTGKMNQLPALFDKREAMVNASDLPPEEKQERLDEITEDREALEAGEDIFAERHRLSEEGVLGAENYEKITKARGNVGDASRAAGMSELDKEAKKAATQKVLADIGIDAAKMAELPSGTQKNVNTESQAYEVKSTTGKDAKEILAMMTEMDRSTGLFGKGKRYLTQVVGTGSDEDILATRLESLVNAKIMGERKPGEGPMTDPDYKAKRATAPSIDASPQEWGDYLGRLEKTSYQDASKAVIKMKFLGGNNHFGQNTNKNLVINGRKVPVGSTAVEFIRDNKSLWEYTKENEDKPPKGSRIRKWNPQTKAFE